MEVHQILICTSISFYKKLTGRLASNTHDAYTVHDGIYIKNHWTSLNDPNYFPSFGSLRTVIYFWRVHKCLGAMDFVSWRVLLSCEFFNILTITDH